MFHFRLQGVISQKMVLFRNIFSFKNVNGNVLAAIEVGHFKSKFNNRRKTNLADKIRQRV
jgi:hypothetical protein